MLISTWIPRMAAFYTRHGLGATMCRVALAVRRALFSNRMVLLYCDLSEEVSRPVGLLDAVTVERKTRHAELSQVDLQAITSFWNPKLALRKIDERFTRGALLWLIKSEDRLAGYGWTLAGRTIELHYFPLGQHDVHLFDFHVFPEFRGRGINPSLVGYILRQLAAEGGARAFIEAAEWNLAQLASLGKTPFHRFGRARKWTICGHTMVWWARNEVLPLESSASAEGLPTPAPSKRRSSALKSVTSSHRRAMP
jgi:ribosomal protein S18 acetylase RimI-like enzyme